MDKNKNRISAFSLAFLPLLSLALLHAVPAPAQDLVFRYPQVNEPAHFDVSRPVRELGR